MTSRHFLLLGTALLMVLLMAGCPVTSTKATPFPPSTDRLQKYENGKFSFSVSYSEGWIAHTTDATTNEGVIVTFSPPLPGVSVSVARDFPPPTADLPGFGHAMGDVLRLSFPGLFIMEEGPVSLSRGSLPAYRLKFNAASTPPLRGEMTVVMREERDFTEAFLIQASGEEGEFEKREAEVRVLVDSFRLTE